MRWHPNLYLDDRIREHPRAVIEKIEQGDYGSRYVITLAYNGKDQLDIRPAASLARSYLREGGPLIVAVCSGKKEAMRMLERMVQDCCRQTGDVNLREWLAGREER